MWIITIHSLLRALTEEGFEPVCYADDVLILLRGRDPNQLCRRAEQALNIALNWARPRGLNVNPDKTEICLFTRKTKIAPYDNPLFQNKEIKISSQVKYLGVILDRKLKWRPHLEERVVKAHRCWSICRRAIGSKWGLNPKMTHWLYRSVIRPLITYASVVWWTSMERKCNIEILQRIQRMCCLGISGAMRTTPTRALETILFVQPIDIRVRYEAALTAYRLQAMGEWSIHGHKSYHQHITDTLYGYQYDTEIFDRMQVKLKDTNCNTQIPDRHSWSNVTLSQTPVGTRFYTDGSKQGDRTGLGLYIDEPETRISLRLPNHSTILQAEIRAIKECIVWAKENVVNLPNKDLYIFTDSQRAIRSLQSRNTSSRTVLDCKEAINDFSSDGRVHIIWVPGHQGIFGNEEANVLANRARDLPNVSLENPMPFSALKTKLQEWAQMSHKSLWNTGTVGRTTKILWGDPDERKSMSILNLSKGELCKLMSVLTGHSSLQQHLNRIGVIEDNECRACREDIETMEHFLCHCPAFASTRSEIFEDDTLPNMAYLRGVDWRKLRRYINKTELL